MPGTGEKDVRRDRLPETEQRRRGRQIHVQREKLLHRLGGRTQTGQTRGRTAK